MFSASCTALLSALGSTWLPVLVDAAVKGTAVLVVACIAGLFARRSSAATRHLVWFLAMVSLLAMPALSMVLPGWQVLPEWFDLSGAAALGTDESALRPPVAEPFVPPATDGSASPAGVGPRMPGDTVGGPPEVGDSETRTAMASRAAPQARVAEERRLWSAASLRVWILPIWAAGAAAVLAPMLIAMLSLWRLRRTSRRVSGGPLAALLERLSAELGMRRRVALLQSSRRSMPMAWGLVRPKLLVPDEAEGWSPECLRAVLLHELAHIKRWDCLTQLVARVACGLYWFNPLAWLALNRMVAEHERACDDVVLAAGGKAPEYAEHLLKVASRLPAVRFSMGVGIALARPSKLEGRLLAILDGRRSRRAVTRAAVLAAVVTLAAVAVPLAILRPMAQAAPDAEQTAVAPTSAGGAAKEADPSPQSGLGGGVRLAGWGEPDHGIRLRLTASEKEYRKIATLPLWVELENAGTTRLAPMELLEAKVTAEVVDVNGRALRVRPPAEVTPWEGRMAACGLAAGAPIRWTVGFDRFEFLDRPAAGSTVRLRLRVSSRDFNVASQWVELSIKDSPPAPVRPGDVPDVWAGFMDLVYREDGSAGLQDKPLDPSGGSHAAAMRAVHVDGRTGRVTVTVRSGGDDDWLGWHEAVMDRTDLDRLAALLKRHAVWKLAELKPGLDADGLRLVVGTGSLRLSLSVVGRLLDFEFPLDQASEDPALLAIRKEMWVLAAKVVTRAREDQKGWGALSDEGVQSRLRADKREWPLGHAPMLVADVRNLGMLDLSVAQAQQGWEAEVDGQWYQRTGGKGLKYSPFESGRAYDGIQFTLGSEWRSKDGDKPLSLGAGKHTVRVAPVCMTHEEKTPMRAVGASNVIEIEVLPAAVAATHGVPVPAVTVPEKMPPTARPSPANGEVVGSDRKAGTAFGTFRVEAKSFWAWNRTLVFRGDGTYTFEMQTLEQVPGEKHMQPSKTPYVASYRLSPGDLEEFARLLKATGWLSLPASPRPVAVDATEYAMTLSRGQETARRTYHEADKVQAYVDLTRFLRRVERQEELLFAVTHRESPFPGSRDLGDELDGMMGGRNRARPYAPALDYQRLVPAYGEFLANPRLSPQLAADAARLMGYLKLESQRRGLEELVLGQASGDPSVPAEVRKAAVEALGLMGAGQSLDVLKTAGQADGSVRDAVAGALATASSNKTVPILKDLAGSSQQAAWVLIRQGLAAEPALHEIFTQPGDETVPSGRAAYHVIRAYVDHWKELPGPPSAATVSAVQDRIRLTGKGSLSGRYGLDLLRLADVPFGVPNAWQSVEEFLSMMSDRGQTERQSLFLPKHFTMNPPPERLLENTRGGTLKVRAAHVDGTTAWAHVADDKNQASYALLLGLNGGVLWTIEVARSLPAEKVQEDLDRFLKAHPKAQAITAGEDRIEKASSGRGAEDVRQFAKGLLAAIRDRDLAMARRLSAGAVGGWLTPEEAKELSGPAPAGWSAERLETAVKEIHEIYAGNPELIRSLRAVEVRGGWARVHMEGLGDEAVPRLILILQRTAEGWRLADVAEAKGALAQDLEIHADRLGRWQVGLAARRAKQVKEAARVGKPDGLAAATSPAPPHPAATPILMIGAADGAAVADVRDGAVRVRLGDRTLEAPTIIISLDSGAGVPRKGIVLTVRDGAVRMSAEGTETLGEMITIHPDGRTEVRSREATDGSPKAPAPAAGGKHILDGVVLLVEIETRLIHVPAEAKVKMEAGLAGVGPGALSGSGLLSREQADAFLAHVAAIKSVHTLAAPKVAVVENQEAHVFVGENRPLSLPLVGAGAPPADKAGIRTTIILPVGARVSVTAALSPDGQSIALKAELCVNQLEEKGGKTLLTEARGEVQTVVPFGHWLLVRVPPTSYRLSAISQKDDPASGKISMEVMREPVPDAGKASDSIWVLLRPSLAQAADPGAGTANAEAAKAMAAAAEADALGTANELKRCQELFAAKLISQQQLDAAATAARAAAARHEAALKQADAAKAAIVQAEAALH